MKSVSATSRQAAHPPTAPGSGMPPRPPAPSAIDQYQAVADTIGGPSLRVKDNVIQAVVIVGSMIVGAGIGWLVNRGVGAAIGAVAGMIISTFLSGSVLMVLGWVRASKRLKADRGMKTGRCAHCGYDLTGSLRPRCPECGKIQSR